MTNTRMMTRRSLLLAKTETTYGSDPTPTAAANSIIVIDAEIKEVREKVERPVGQKWLGITASILGTQYQELTFKVELKGSGSIALPPRIGTLLLACAMTETIASGVSVTYKPVTGESTVYSCTIWLYKDGKLYKLNGCRGTWKLIAEAGKTALLEFTMRGSYVTPTTGAFPSPVYETTIPPVCKSGTFTYNSKTTLVVGTMEVDIGNVIANRPDLSSANGVVGFEITDRKPIASINPEAQVETSYDFRGDQLATVRQISLAIGGTATNICTVTIPKFNIDEIALEDMEGILHEKITGECTTLSGDNELQLVFT